MKKLFFVSLLLFFVTSLSAQTKYNFFGLYGNDYYDITDKKMKYEDILTSDNLGQKLLNGGFNHYEINLEKKTFTHNYVTLETGEPDRKEVVSKITNLVYGKGFIKFNVTTKDFGKLNLVINKDNSDDIGFVVVFKESDKTYAAVFK
jgi:hypothetical protein